VEQLNELAAEYHQNLTGTAERLRVSYRPGFVWRPEAAAAAEVMADPTAALARSLREQVRRQQARDIAQGVSLLGRIATTWLSSSTRPTSPFTAPAASNARWRSLSSWRRAHTLNARPGRSQCCCWTTCCRNWTKGGATTGAGD